MILNSVSALTMEKWTGRDHQYFVRVIWSALVQVEIHSPAITRMSGDAVKDRQFRHDCELTDGE